MHYFPRSRSGQVHSLMAALTCLRSVETNLTLTCPSPKSFVCNLPDSGRHVTSVFLGSLSLARSVGRVGENPGNEVGEMPQNLRLESTHDSGAVQGLIVPRYKIYSIASVTSNTCSHIKFYH